MFWAYQYTYVSQILLRHNRRDLAIFCSIPIVNLDSNLEIGLFISIAAAVWHMMKIYFLATSNKWISPLSCHLTIDHAFSTFHGSYSWHLSEAYANKCSLGRVIPLWPAYISLQGRRSTQFLRILIRNGQMTLKVLANDPYFQYRPRVSHDVC